MVYYIRKTLPVLLVLMFLLSVTVLHARDGQIIREIIVVGTTRTNEGVIRSQLPFQEGDIWREEFSSWAIRRLRTLDIFAYEPMRITAEPVSEHECRVMVRLADPSILYKDPAEFIMMGAMRLSYRQVFLTANNPLGTGQNLNLNITWGHNYSYGGSITSPLGGGMISLGGRYYRGDYTFSNTSYESSGWSADISRWYWWNRFLRQSSRIQYHDFELDGNQGSLVIPSTSFLYDDKFSALLTGSVGVSLQDDPVFWRLQGAVSSQIGPIIALARAGYTAQTTPDHMRFAVGGFSLLPLRGENPWHLARAYVIGTGEYHFSPKGMLAPIVFADGGWVWNDGIDAELHEMVINVGAGIAFYTPLGIPVRLDAAINPVNPSSWGWKIGFGHSYIPVF